MEIYDRLALEASVALIYFVSDRLGQRQPTTPGSPMKRKSSMHRVHHHRRTSSVLTAGLGILAEKYSALSAECLRTLRVEMQLEAIYHLQVSSSSCVGMLPQSFVKSTLLDCLVTFMCSLKFILCAEHGGKSLCH